ncbi:hypothetical protein PENTCL1PPCAC_4062, partial [Pristionchus entomophagus]
LLLLLLPLSDAFFFGNSGCGCQLLPPPPPLPVFDQCACRKDDRPVFRDPPTLPFMPLQQSSIYYAPPPAASPTYYSAPGPVIAREYIPVNSYQTSPVGFHSGTFPIGQDPGVSFPPPFARRPQFAFQRSNEDRLNRYSTSSYALPPLQPSQLPALPPPIILPPLWPSQLPQQPPQPAPTPPPADWPGWQPIPPPPPRPSTTPAPADWPGWTTPTEQFTVTGKATVTRKFFAEAPPPPPPPRPTPPPSDWVTTQPPAPSNPYWNPQTTTPPPQEPPPPPPPPPSNPYWNPQTTTPPPQDWTTRKNTLFTHTPKPPPPPPPPPPTTTSKPWNPYNNDYNNYKPQNQVYSVNDIVVDVMRPPPSLSHFPPGSEIQIFEFPPKSQQIYVIVKMPQISP